MCRCVRVCVCVCVCVCLLSMLCFVYKHPVCVKHFRANMAAQQAEYRDKLHFVTFENRFFNTLS